MKLHLKNLICVLVLVSCATAGAEPFIERDRPMFVNDDRFMFRLPSLLVTSDGTVLAACKKELGTTDSDWALTDLVLKRSTDNGTTWGEEQTVLHRDGYVIFNGNLVEDRDTKTIFACFIMFPRAERRMWFLEKWIQQGGGFWICRSADDGASWSDPEFVVPKPGPDEPKNRLDLTGYFSHDDGRSWIKGNRVSQTGGYSDIAVLPDKRIVVLYENRTDDTLPHGLLLARFNLEWLTGE